MNGQQLLEAPPRSATLPDIPQIDPREHREREILQMLRASIEISDELRRRVVSLEQWRKRMEVQS